MNAHTYKPFMSASPTTEGPALPSMDTCEPEEGENHHMTSATASNDENKSKNGAEIAGNPSKRRKLTDKREDDRHTGSTPSQDTSITNDQITLPPVLSRSNTYPPETGTIRRPSSLFQSGQPETRKGGHPAELVTPENKMVNKDNNGPLKIVGVISPITWMSKDNNAKLITDCRLRELRRLHSI